MPVRSTSGSGLDDWGFVATNVAPPIATPRTLCIFETAGGPPTVFSKGPEFALILDERWRILSVLSKSCECSERFASVKILY
jgi:hypothetical protein